MEEDDRPPPLEELGACGSVLQMFPSGAEWAVGEVAVTATPCGVKVPVVPWPIWPRPKPIPKPMPEPTPRSSSWASMVGKC